MLYLIRTIHPVGQGAFYSEYMQIYNKKSLVIYDCGTRSKGNFIENTIKQDLPENVDVDILFISHFDLDHVNGLKCLLEKRKIRNIVIPQYKDTEWFYIISDYITHSYKTKPDTQLIHNILSQFPKDSKIIQVAPLELNDDDVSKQQLDIGDEYISSGVQLNSRINVMWCYIPINYNIGYNIKRLHDDIEKIAPGITSMSAVNLGNFLADENNRRKINEIYQHYFRNTNVGSMCVYSGMKNGNSIYSISSLNKISIHDQEACFYTGDSDMTDTNKIRYIRAKLGSLNKRIGLFQIPHHGSAHNFNKKMFRDLQLNVTSLSCFVSHGNMYGHPAVEVVKDVQNMTGKFPIEVTRLENTILKQRIFGFFCTR